MIAATPLHAAALAAIHGAAFPAGQRWGPDAIALQLALPGAFGWLDDRGGMVLARIAADEAEILTLAVVPASRRQGIARALLRGALRQAGERGALEIFLEVASGNFAAHALYRAAGFAEVGRRRDYYGYGRDALVMRAAIIPCGSEPR